jgi:hypothetical protein
MEEEGVSLMDGTLLLEHPGITIERATDSIQWRFHLSWRAMNPRGKVPLSIEIRDHGRSIAEVGFHANGNIFFTSNGFDRMGTAYIPGKWYDFKIEADLVNDRYNLLVDGRKIGDWIPMKKSSLVNAIRIRGGQGVRIDDFSGLYFDTTGCVPGQPYRSVPFLQEDFNIHPPLNEWYMPAYDDRTWTTDRLPIVHGKDLCL